MNLPNSEPLPENISELPPARQRHIRRQPHSASLAERQLLLESLLSLTAPRLNFFILSLLGSITLGAALYFDDPAVLIGAIVMLPFLKPAFGLALLPASRKATPAHKSLISLLILLVLTFTSGLLAGYLQKEFSPRNITLYRFSAPYWLDLTIVSISAILSAFVMIRKGALPRLIGVPLAYEILLPLAVAGFSFPLGTSDLFPSGLLVGLAHLGLLVLLAAITFFALGFGPKKPLGYSFILLPVLLIAGGLLLTLPNLPKFAETKLAPSKTPTLPADPSNTPVPTATKTETTYIMIHTQTSLPTHTPSPSPSETQTTTQTATPKPTTYGAVVEAAQGAVMRDSPTFDAPVVGYLNNGDAIEIIEVTTSEEGTLWYWVSTLTGQNGWLLGSLINTQTPTPTPE